VGAELDVQVTDSSLVTRSVGFTLSSTPRLPEASCDYIL